MATQLAARDELYFDVDPQVAEANALVIVDQGKYEVGVTIIQGIKELKKEIDAQCDPLIKAAHETHKKAVAQKKGFYQPLDEAENLIRGKMSEWDRHVEAERAKEEARLAEQARKEREKIIARGQKKIDAILEKTGDANVQIQALNKELEGDVDDTERLMIENKIEVLTIALNESQEAALRKQAELERQVEEVPTAPIPTMPTTKTNGVSKTKTRVATVTNRMMLIKAVAAGTVPDAVLKIDEGQLKKYANMISGPIPGCSISVQYGQRIR